MICWHCVSIPEILTADHLKPIPHLCPLFLLLTLVNTHQSHPGQWPCGSEASGWTTHCAVP